ncbi:porin [Orrella daihaiensis]|uniref:Porin n=1 Tax=Orrella daihaiensis TaxID=2782176 RepID=A0ABY4AJ00_9BURK|nr:porin [Orrella daihaiensis]
MHTSAQLSLYGAADVGISYVRTSQNGATENRLGMDSSVLDDSMIGFKGRDRLNHDWTATFNLATEINLYNGNISYTEFFGIESTLGLTRRHWGSFKFGRQQTASTNFFTAIDPMGLSFGQANMGTSFTAINTQIYNNLAQITSDNWKGFQFSVGYSFDTGETALYEGSGTNNPIPSTNGFNTTDKMRALTSAIQYENGPLLVVASYDRAYPSKSIGSPSISGQPQPNPTTANPQAWYVGLAYTLHKVVLSAAWGRGINGAFSGSGPGNDIDGSRLASLAGDADMLFSPGFNQNAYLLGFSWAIDDRTQLMASWQMLQPTGQLASMPGVSTQQILGAALTYNLSPRTTAYVWASYGQNFEMASGAQASVIGTGIQTLF